MKCLWGLISAALPCLALTCVVMPCAALRAQASAPATNSPIQNIGFSYALPANWQVTQAPFTPAANKQPQPGAASSETSKTGNPCAQIALTASRASSNSMIVVLQFPGKCLGKPVLEKDLPGFVQQALQNIRQTMILSDEVHGSYMLGTHPMQIERASGVVIGAPDIRYTVEITCSVLHRGAVCWMGMAAALPDLTTFEQGRVSLDGEPAAFLVPPNVFRKNAPTSAPNR